MIGLSEQTIIDQLMEGLMTYWRYRGARDGRQRVQEQLAANDQTLDGK
jgi:hypothetical protein